MSTYDPATNDRRGTCPHCDRRCKVGRPDAAGRRACLWHRLEGRPSWGATEKRCPGTGEVCREDREPGGPAGGHWVVVVNDNSYRTTMPFEERDAIVDPADGNVIRRGDEPELVAYRERMRKRRQLEIDADMRALGVAQ